jgi:uncharacterized membrane protein YhhN
MKNTRYALLLVPLTFAFLAVIRPEVFFFRAAVSASCAVILWFMSGYHGVRWVIAALLVSIGGDWFMSHIGSVPIRFLYGVCLFFIAHLGFLCFCLKNGRINLYVLLPVLAGYLVFFFVALLPALSLPILFISILVYVLVSCFSLAAAAGLRLQSATRWVFSLGIGLLMFSDTLIALRSFARVRGLGFLILPTYFASHIVITLALMLYRRDTQKRINSV